MTIREHPLKKFIRPGTGATRSCPGCGNGIVSQSILRAIDELDRPIDDFIFVSGIGCSAWIPSPFYNTDVLHTTHGRPIAYASGVKFGLPDKSVVVVSGDGDLTAIGGNHLIHAARRNMDITVICINNGIYGMTGGQMAPTTPLGARTSTTPFGSYEHPFEDLAGLVAKAGGSFVARWTTYHANQLTRSIKKAFARKGFSFIEVVSQCPVQFGRRTGRGDAVTMLGFYKKNSLLVGRASSMRSEDLEGRIIIGEIKEEDKASLMDQMDALRKEVMRSES